MAIKTCLNLHAKKTVRTLTKFKPTSKRITLANNSASEFDKLVKLTNLINDDITEFNKPWYIRVTNNASEIRNNAQNALYACYVKEISKNLGNDIKDVRRFCKRNFGLHVLYEQSKDNTKAGHEAFAVITLLQTVNFKFQNWQIQENILEPLPCTSIMTSKNFVDFLKRIEIFYAQKGIVLESINEKLRREAFNE